MIMSFSTFVANLYKTQLSNSVRHETAITPPNAIQIGGGLRLTGAVCVGKDIGKNIELFPGRRKPILSDLVFWNSPNWPYAKKFPTEPKNLCPIS
jgi:hypothetical protein